MVQEIRTPEMKHYKWRCVRCCHQPAFKALNFSPTYKSAYRIHMTCLTCAIELKKLSSYHEKHPAIELLMEIRRR